MICRDLSRTIFRGDGSIAIPPLAIRKATPQQPKELGFRLCEEAFPSLDTAINSKRQSGARRPFFMRKQPKGVKDDGSISTTDGEASYDDKGELQAQQGQADFVATVDISEHKKQVRGVSTEIDVPSNRKNTAGRNTVGYVSKDIVRDVFVATSVDVA